MLIDCDGCTVRGYACRTCVVTVVLGAPAAPRDGDPPAPMALDEVDRRALRVLADAGLVPRLRHEARRAG